MKSFLIKEDLANHVLNYLAGRPYVEVYQLVQGLQQLPEAPGPMEVAPGVKVHGVEVGK